MSIWLEKTNQDPQKIEFHQRKGEFDPQEAKIRSCKGVNSQCKEMNLQKRARKPVIPTSKSLRDVLKAAL
ncbi:hypothetical protein K0M31_018839 [Melipona bicolor]|uniref:Uncharacterized protein n=1 Tax=Melipona bicolor TaxID=60889 RepID=A0AA40G429_9HYME|nr:hypothetical protein K0M31_018839 [Melipona bicolor]